MTLPLCVAIPSWGKPYVELAIKWTIPATLAALACRDEAAPPPRFFIHTDDRAAFAKALVGHAIEFFDHKVDLRERDGAWIAFKRAHREALARTPEGSVAVLLNSDIVVSRETFVVVDRVFADPVKKAVVSVGIRTLIDGNKPPLGVDAQTLSRWIWSHRHSITDDCIWGRGRTGHPTILFFEDGANVAMHGFHLTPMFVRKDRDLEFKGTIDDDMLEHYADDEVFFVRNGEFAVAELSPAGKAHKRAPRLDLTSVVEFGGPRFSDSHMRNFGNRIKVIGEPREHPAVQQILAGLRATR